MFPFSHGWWLVSIKVSAHFYDSVPQCYYCAILHKGDRVTRWWDTTRGHTCWMVGLGLWLLLLLLLLTASQCPMAVLCLAKGRLLHTSMTVSGINELG